VSKTIGIAVLLIAAAGGAVAAVRYAGYWPVGGQACCGGDSQAATAPGQPAPDQQPDDKALAEAQGYCPVMPDTKLGEMGEPVKVMVKDKSGIEQPVFVCCKGCKRKALANPDKTLAKVAELKAAKR
jgi:hypothetical protein